MGSGTHSTLACLAFLGPQPAIKKANAKNKTVTFRIRSHYSFFYNPFDMLFLAKRFVAGVTRQEALVRSHEALKSGFFTTIDHLGEHVTDPVEAQRVSREYLDIFAESQATLNGSAPAPGAIEPVNISVKPTNIGLDISEEEALKNLRPIAASAKRLNNFVRLDMEGSRYTDATLRLTQKLQAEFGPCVGVVIQAYLYRSHDDIENLIHSKTRVRLCKGAYKEPKTISLADKEQVNAHYDKLCEFLLEHGNYPAIATHDEERIKKAISASRRFNKSPKDFEFQMLLGVRENLARELVKSGFRVRLYLPYGKDWAGYFYRRIRERKENLMFALSSILRK